MVKKVGWGKKKEKLKYVIDRTFLIKITEKFANIFLLFDNAHWLFQPTWFLLLERENILIKLKGKVWIMVPVLDSNSEHVAHAWREIGLYEKICDCSRSN